VNAVTIYYAALLVAPNAPVYVEDDHTADGTEEDPTGATLAFGSTPDSPDLLLRLPDKTAEQVILELLRNSPRLSRRVLDGARHLIRDRMEEGAYKVRERLDPGPLPIGKENEG